MSESRYEARGREQTVYIGRGMISLEPKEGLMAETIPPHVVRIFKDDEGRRCTSFVAVCNSASEDNAANAEFIAEAFNRRTANSLALAAELLGRAVRQ